MGPEVDRHEFLEPVLMVTSVTPPIVTDDSGDINLYGSVEAACQDMEATDVLDGVYVVFDSSGHRLAPAVAEGRVQLGVDVSAAPEPEELARRLRHFISRVGPERVGVRNVEDASLAEAIDALATFFRLR